MHFHWLLTVIKGHAHRWRQIHVSGLIFLFSCPKNSSINQLNFYCIKQIDYIFSLRVHCNRSQKTSQRVKNNSHVTLLRCDVICDLLQYTRTKICNLFVNSQFPIAIARVTVRCYFVDYYNPAF